MPMVYLNCWSMEYNVVEFKFSFQITPLQLLQGLRQVLYGQIFGNAEKKGVICTAWALLLCMVNADDYRMIFRSA